MRFCGDYEYEPKARRARRYTHNLNRLWDVSFISALLTLLFLFGNSGVTIFFFENIDYVLFCLSFIVLYKL